MPIDPLPDVPYTESIRAMLPVPVLFVALKVISEVPGDVGVPVITPVVVFTANPLGSPVPP